MHELEYEERLENLKLPSLEFRRLRGDMIEVYKIFHGLYDTKTVAHLLSPNKTFITRGHQYKLSKQHVKTSLNAHFFY